MNASKITTGTWVANIGNFTVRVYINVNKWATDVTGGGAKVSAYGFDTPVLAVDAAATYLRGCGLSIVIADRPDVTLSSSLYFRPAPQLCAV